jgi:hypothetical protein
MRTEVILHGYDLVYNGASAPALESDDAMKLDAGETGTVVFPFTFTDVSRPIMYECDNKLCVYKGFVNANGTGTEITSALDVDVYPTATHIKFVVTNTGGTNGYVTTLRDGGLVAALLERDWKFSSTNTYMESSFTMENIWFNVFKASYGTGSKSGSTSVGESDERIQDIGNSILNHVSTLRPYPIVSMQGRYDQQFAIELEDKVKLELPTFGIDDNFRVSKIAHQSQGSPQEVQTTYWLYPPIEPST